MLKINQILSLLFIVLLMSSCEEDYILVKNDFKPKIVVNCIFKPGEKWLVNISTSKDILSHDSEINKIENAKITITQKSNNNLILLTHIGNGDYTYDYDPPIADRTYVLEVKVPGYDPIKAESKAPKNANIVNIITDVVDKKVTKVNFQVKDEINNYLIWNFIKSDIKNPLDSSFNGNPKDFVTGIVKYNNLSNISNMLIGLTDAENNAVTSDGSFSSSVINENSDLPDSTSGNPVNNVVETKKFLRFITASGDMYNYYKSVEKFLKAPNHNSSISNTPHIYSNIINGLGIFAGYTEEFKEIK